MLDILQKRLKLLRKSYDMSIYEIALITSVGRATLNGWENGTKIPTIDTLYEVATHFGISIDWLCGISDIPYTTESVERALNLRWDESTLFKIPGDNEIGEDVLDRIEKFALIRDKEFSLESLSNLVVLMQYPQAIAETSQIWFDENDEFTGRNRKKVSKYQQVLEDLKKVFFTGKSVYKLTQDHE